MKKYHQNNFTALRLVAAIMVLFSHNYVLLGRNLEEPLVKASGTESLAFIAVCIFFVISGYLVTGSWRNSSGFRDFVKKRMLRILPGLFVCTVITVVLFGPLLSTLTVEEYFSSAETYYYLKNSLLYGITYDLPGVFKTNPVSKVNGSLWTLPIEFSLYLGLALVATIGLLKRNLLILAVVGGFIGELALIYIQLPIADGVLIKLRYLLHFSLMFALGALWMLTKDTIRIKWWMAALSVVITIASFKSSLCIIFMLISVPLCTAYLATAWGGKLWIIDKLGDYSYGIYIYAFPLQQAVIYYFGSNISLLFLMFASLSATTLFAAISWHLVEKPALNLKENQRSANRTRPSFSR